MAGAGLRCGAAEAAAEWTAQPQFSELLCITPMRFRVVALERESHRIFPTLLAALMLGCFAPAFAQNPPHSQSRQVNCADCHLNHHLYGDQADSTFANANLCLSCHQAGGSAAKLALANANQAQLAGALPGGAKSTGNSHRWDGSPSGRVTSPTGLAPGAVQVSGIYTGRYAGVYTITITTAGSWTLTADLYFADGDGMDESFDDFVPASVTITVQ